MLMEEDWLTRQIQQTIDIICKVFLSKEISFTPESFSENEAEEPEQLRKALSALIAERKISEAEDLLYESITSDLRYLSVGLSFYEELNNLTNQALIQADFPREEIGEGLEDLMDSFGLVMPIETDY